MYNQVGKKIKNVVTAVVCVVCAVSVLAGLVIWLIMATSTRDGGMGFFIGILVAGIGCFLAWLSGLLIYALGEIADSLMSIQGMLSKMSMNAETQKVSVEPAHNKNENEGGTIVYGEPQFTNEGEWICFSCKTANRANHDYCAKCKVSRKWSDEKYRKGW